MALVAGAGRRCADRVYPTAGHFARYRSLVYLRLPRAASARESIPRKIMSGSRRPSMDGGRRLSLGLTTTDEQIKPAWAAFLDAGEVCRPPIASRCAHSNPPGARIWPSHPSRPGPSRSRPLPQVLDAVSSYHALRLACGVPDDAFGRLDRSP